MYHLVDARPFSLRISPRLTANQHPLSVFRLEAIAQDAELEEHSTEEMKKLVESLTEACKKAAADFDSAEKNAAEGEKKVS